MQKRTATTDPYLSVCLVVRNEERTIEQCLQSVRDRAPEAEIVVIDTCSQDKTREIAEKYADIVEVYHGPAGDWDEETPWVTDMAAARQHSFERASGRWRMWIDGDDRLAGPEEAERILKLNDRWQPAREGQEVADTGGNGKPAVMTLEDTLRFVEEHYPEGTCVYAPYLYKHHDDGLADIWQERERIVLWDEEKPEFYWSEAAHEVLVPTNPLKLPTRIDFSTLLFIHEKDFDQNNKEWTVNRHWDVLIGYYNRGEITTRRCTYLANLAKHKEGQAHRIDEFLQAAHQSASTTHERYQALLAIAEDRKDKGMFHESMEHYGAAKELFPNLPDAWISSGLAHIESMRFAEGLEFMERGLKCPITPQTFLNPRHFVIQYPTLMANAYIELGKRYIRQGVMDAATKALDRAVFHSRNVAVSDCVGADLVEARARLGRADNLKKGHEQALAIYTLWKYLRDNDESIKAANLLENIPNTILDHPLIISMENWARKINKHVTDPQAYHDFYNNIEETGYKGSPDITLTVNGTHDRVRWMAQQIQAHNPKAKCLEVGTCDGIAAIPILQMCPEITYDGYDFSKVAVESMQGFLEQFNVADRGTSKLLEATEGYPTGYDVVVFSEVIEHVPDPIKSLTELKACLNKDGIIVMTCPWGPIDNGLPPEQNVHGNPRDERGHVRAIQPRDMALMLEGAGLEAVQLTQVPNCGYLGPAMCVVARPKLEVTERPTAFVAPGSLWDWHGRSVHAEGIGASEETIVYLAKALRNERVTGVYTQNLTPDTHDLVGYWPREHVRHLRGTDTKIVVSRAPGYGIDQLMGDADQILWLQDTVYPELNNETAKLYQTIVCVSNWHKELTIKEHKLDEENAKKVIVIPNFLLREHFEISDPPERKRDHFIYASSPDRGLTRLLELWPRIRAMFPEATLDVFYGWRGCKVLGASRYIREFELNRRKYDQLKHQDGITERGMVSHPQIAREFMRAGVWAYPTNFHETCCTNAYKARAGGAVPVATALAALKETAKCPQGTLIDPDIDDYDDAFIAAVRKAVNIDDVDRLEMQRNAIEDYSIENVLPKWREILK